MITADQHRNLRTAVRLLMSIGRPPDKCLAMAMEQIALAFSPAVWTRDADATIQAHVDRLFHLVIARAEFEPWETSTARLTRMQHEAAVEEIHRLEGAASHAYYRALYQPPTPG